MISIIIPTYNRAHIISKTLESIMSQDFENWECIVVDDKSTDNTRELVSSFSEKDSRIRYLLNERKKGAQGARNTGVLSAGNEWLYFFDSDNYMHSDCLKVMSSCVNDNIDVIQCFSKVINVETGDTGKTFSHISQGDIHQKLFEGKTYVDFNNSIVRKSKVLEIGLLDEDCPSMQEWDTHIRLSKIATYFTIEKVLVDYYVGAKDAISTDTKREVKGRMFILTKHLKEWKQHPRALKNFVCQIKYFIDRNSDPQFRREAYSNLKLVVPATPFYVFLYRTKSILKRILK